MFTSGSVDTHNPQRAKLALFLPTVTVGVLPRFDNRLFGNLELTRSGTVIPFRLF